MTDNTAANSAPEPQDQPFPNGDPPPATPAQAGPQANWDVITFPGQMAIAEAPAAVTAEDAPPPGAVSAAPEAAPLHRTEDLIQLIQDLNQCNDALLMRVSDLEESLERSQAALQAEVEHHQGLATSDRGIAPTQIAQLLSEIDAANDGLRRATLHNETLQTDLEASQQRVAQLERECTLLQQRFSEKNTALQQAEDSCRDLKARLHRQQRYTLQFKTALEKCLNMASDGSPTPVASTPAMGIGRAEAQPVAMPKAQEIQPWAASRMADQQPVALANLMQHLKPAVPMAKSTTDPTTDPTALTTTDPTTDPTVAAPVATTPTPSLSTLPTIVPTPSPALQDSPAPAAQTPSAVTDPWFAPAADTEPDPVFTEPSPWGSPLAPPPEPQGSEATKGTATTDATPEAMEDLDVPPRPEAAWIAQANSTRVAPVSRRSTAPTAPAYAPPSQRRIASLAAVQLPSFGRSPRRS